MRNLLSCSNRFKVNELQLLGMLELERAFIQWIGRYLQRSSMAHSRAQSTLMDRLEPRSAFFTPLHPDPLLFPQSQRYGWHRSWVSEFSVSLESPQT